MREPHSSATSFSQSLSFSFYFALSVSIHPSIMSRFFGFAAAAAASAEGHAASDEASYPWLESRQDSTAPRTPSSFMSSPPEDVTDAYKHHRVGNAHVGHSYLYAPSFSSASVFDSSNSVGVPPLVSSPPPCLSNAAKDSFLDDFAALLPSLPQPHFTWTNPSSTPPPSIYSDNVSVVSHQWPQSSSPSSSLSDAASDMEAYLAYDHDPATAHHSHEPPTPSLSGSISSSSELPLSPVHSMSERDPDWECLDLSKPSTPTSHVIDPSSTASLTTHTASSYYHQGDEEKEQLTQATPPILAMGDLPIMWLANLTSSNRALASSSPAPLLAAPSWLPPLPLLPHSAAPVTSTSSVQLSDTFRLFAVLAASPVPICLTGCSGEPTHRLPDIPREGPHFDEGESTTITCHRCKHPKDSTKPKKSNPEDDTLLPCRWSNCSLVFCYGCLQRHFKVTLDMCRKATYLHCPCCFKVCNCGDCNKPRSGLTGDEKEDTYAFPTPPPPPLPPTPFQPVPFTLASALEYGMQMQAAMAEQHRLMLEIQEQYWALFASARAQSRGAL